MEQPEGAQLIGWLAHYPDWSGQIVVFSDELTARRFAMRNYMEVEPCLDGQDARHPYGVEQA